MEAGKRPRRRRKERPFVELINLGTTDFGGG